MIWCCYMMIWWCFDRELICSSSGECRLTVGFLEKDAVVTAEDGRHDAYDDDDDDYHHDSRLFSLPHIIIISLWSSSLSPSHFIIIIIISIIIIYHHHHHHHPSLHPYHHPSGLVGVILNETSFYYESGEGQHCITRPVVMKLWMTVLIRLSLSLSSHLL